MKKENRAKLAFHNDLKAQFNRLEKKDRRKSKSESKE